LTDQDVIEQAAKEAFKALQAKARAKYGSNTGALMVVYAVESFLRRLAMSEYATQMVLKGGMLMAANSIRQMTKDADLSTHGVANDEDNVRAVVEQICLLTPDPHDGIVIDPATIKTEVMREDAEYQAVRCKLIAGLGRAAIHFALDFSFGDPGRSTTIQLREHVLAVADHRDQPIITMAEALANMPDRQQSYAAMVARMSYLSPPPELWTDLIAGVIEFADPLLGNKDGAFSYWDAEQVQWIEGPGAS
jgi:hypothetical protein